MMVGMLEMKYTEGSWEYILSFVKSHRISMGQIQTLQAETRNSKTVWHLWYWTPNK